MEKRERRLRRQFDALSKNVPKSEGVVRGLLVPRRWHIRIPVAILLIVGGLLGFLPIVGLWMLPLGLLLLALDVPFLQQPISRAMIWGRRTWSTRRRKWQRRRER
ncbi:hypothetical protein [Tranquillimonas alkanivorans]|nr:hypothetical protein [Tranquillimonas alkanivorans]